MRSLIKLSFLAMFVAALLAATGCEDTPLVAGENFTMTLGFDPPDPSFADDPVPDSISSTVSAVVLSAEGIPQEGISVLFSTDIGTLASGGAFRETNSHGVATDTVALTHEDAEAEIVVTARSGALTKTVTIPTELCTGNDRPTAQITPPAAQTLPAGPVNTTVDAALLSGTSSTDPEASPLTYAWTCFSGGPVTTASTVTCQYTYQTTAKTYTVSLIVKDSGLPGPSECALTSTSATVTINVPVGTAVPPAGPARP